MAPIQPTFAIHSAKLVGYLLNVDHPKGGAKARWLLAHGFDPLDPERRATALVDHAKAHWPGRISPVGSKEVKAIVEGPLVAPDSRTPLLRSVWQGYAGMTFMNFVTAYPLRRKA